MSHLKERLRAAEHPYELRDLAKEAADHIEAQERRIAELESMKSEPVAFIDGFGHIQFIKRDFKMGDYFYLSPPAPANTIDAEDDRIAFEAWAARNGSYDLRPAKWQCISVAGEPYTGYVRPYLQARTVHTFEGFVAARKAAK